MIFYKFLSGFSKMNRGIFSKLLKEVGNNGAQRPSKYLTFFKKNSRDPATLHPSDDVMFPDFFWKSDYAANQAERTEPE
jgi:hypothetical protein